MTGETLVTRTEAAGVSGTPDLLASVLAGLDVEHTGQDARAYELVQGVASVRKNLDIIEELAVARARRGGRSWARIGDDLGISKQAAHKKFGHLDPA